MSSSSTAPMSAPRIGPEARSQVIGGPACRKVPLSRPSASAAGPYADQLRPGRQQAAHGQFVGRAPARVGQHARQRGGGAPQRWPPLDRGPRYGLRVQRLTEQVGADGDDVRIGGQKGHRALPAAWRAAWALEVKTDAPRLVKRLGLPRRPCGRPQVPTSAMTTWTSPRVAASIAGARRSAGSGRRRARAPRPSAPPLLAPAFASASSLSVASIIGCALPW
ncbi:hypothetical protein [Nonomuraea dietziae]|uniref:hypothetical protein n=1 Tax=Nonomuraea dietziae TaxID=65515 RepID=UPI0031DDDAB0